MDFLYKLIQLIPHVSKAYAATCGPDELETAVGCLPKDMEGIVGVFLNYATIIGG